MRILIEGQSYLVEDLERIFNDSLFYTKKGNAAIINSVGYYYSLNKKEVVYMLPKVFMTSDVLEKNQNNEDPNCLWENKYTIFKKSGTNQYLNLKELYEIDKLEGSIKHETKYQWIRHISINFYNSLIEFKKRNSKTNIINKGYNNEINTNIGEDEYTYLDLILSFTNFYKKNKSITLFKHIERSSNEAKKPKWEKTIRNTLPIINKRKSPIYLTVRNKKSIIDSQETLILYFFSILNHFKEENTLNINIDKSCNIIKGEAFKLLQINNNGLNKLRKIKYKYFSDTLKRMYKLCEMYFDSLDTGSIKRRLEEFISFKKYNIVFEDMIDKLFSEENNLDVFEKSINNNEITINKLKYNDDGKIIDHLFEHNGLIDTSNIFYIGDSKYYNPGNLADKLSIYKQFTYAKNIIQFNISLFNEKAVYASNKIRYRDVITEGYNITPNFLLYGVINNYQDFENANLSTVSSSLKESIKYSFHLKERLFDRDSLFICQYTINYLFVLNAYTAKSEISLKKHRNEAKEKIRNNFIEYFQNENYSGFRFFKIDIDRIKYYITKNFKILNGRCISIADNEILIALHESDTELKEFLQNEIMLDVTNNSKDNYKFSI